MKKILDYKDYIELSPYINKINFDELNLIKEECERLYENEEIEMDKVDEGLIAKLVGAVGGAWVGPKVGAVIAKVLGIERGLLFNFLTSNFVGAALGVELMKLRNKK